MENFEFYYHIDSGIRQCGRSTALIEAAKKIGAVFIVATESEKMRLRRDHPDLEISSYGDSKLLGVKKPIIFDHYALSHMWKDSSRKFTQLRSELADTKRKLNICRDGKESLVRQLSLSKEKVKDLKENMKDKLTEFIDSL